VWTKPPRFEPEPLSVQEGDQPDLVFDLSYSHELAGEYGTQVDFAFADTDPAAARDANGTIMERVFRLRRWLVDAS
jgi:hypothetical protein